MRACISVCLGLTRVCIKYIYKRNVFTVQQQSQMSRKPDSFKDLVKAIMTAEDITAHFRKLMIDSKRYAQITSTGIQDFFPQNNTNIWNFDCTMAIPPKYILLKIRKHKSNNVTSMFIAICFLFNVCFTCTVFCMSIFVLYTISHEGTQGYRNSFFPASYNAF